MVMCFDKFPFESTLNSKPVLNSYVDSLNDFAKRVKGTKKNPKYSHTFKY